MAASSPANPLLTYIRPSNLFFQIVLFHTLRALSYTFILLKFSFFFLAFANPNFQILHLFSSFSSKHVFVCLPFFSCDACFRRPTSKLFFIRRWKGEKNKILP